MGRGIESAAITEEGSQLNIWVDALILDHEASGIGQYIRLLLEHYCRLYPEDAVTGIFRPGMHIEGVETMNAPAVHGGRRILYEQVVLPGRVRRAKPDVVHFPDYQLPLGRRLTHTVITVHDLAAFVRPEFFPGQKSWLKRTLMARSVALASRVIVPSQATRNDLVNILHVPPDKIAVIPHGVKNPVKPSPNRAWDAPYFLAVGTVEPRKNFAGLIQAYHILRTRIHDVPDLIIAGRLGWMYDDTLALPEKLGVAVHVKFLQYVSEDTLGALYRDAKGFIYPSFYEGFGLPVVEAMCAGIPVVTSSRGSLAELGGDAVWRVDPESVESIADAMASILQHPDDARLRARQGQDWVQQLSWDKAAAATRQVYEAAALGG